MGSCNCNCQQKAEKKEALQDDKKSLYLSSMQYLQGCPSR